MMRSVRFEPDDMFESEDSRRCRYCQGRPPPRKLIRAGLVLLQVGLLAFPPSIFAAENIEWTTAGSGLYVDVAKWSCATCGGSSVYPNNGLGLSYDAIINKSGADVLLDSIAGVAINSLVIGDVGAVNASALTVRDLVPSVLTIAGPTGPGSNVLTVYNGGVLNVEQAGGVTLDLSGTLGAMVASGGQINVQDDANLTLKNASGSGATFNNDGNINVTGGGSAFLMLDGGATSGANFKFSGSGTLTLGGAGAILGNNGDENLVNDVHHTIAGDGLIYYLGSITNNGTLHASTSGAALVVGDPGGLTGPALTNWNGAARTLTGGSYVVEDGATLQLSDIGAHSINTLAGGAAVVVNGTGLLTGDGASNAFAGLTNVTNSSLTLNVGSGPGLQTITPDGAAFLLSSDYGAGSTNPAALTLAGGTQAKVAGTFLNSVSTDIVASNSTLTLMGLSSLTTGAFTNQATVTNNVLVNADAIVNVSGGSSLTVDSLNVFTNNGFANSHITFDGGSLTVNGDVTHSGYGGQTLTLQAGSTGFVTGDFHNDNFLNGSVVNVNGSTLTVLGTFSQTQDAAGFGQSQLNLSNGSLVQVVGLNNGSGINLDGVSNQSQVSILGGSILDIIGLHGFVNEDSGTLSGGSYTVGSGSQLRWAGTDLHAIGSDTSLTLSAEGHGAATTGQLTNNGTSQAETIDTVNGTLTLADGAALTLINGLTNNKTVNVLNQSQLTVSGLGLENIDGSGNLNHGTFTLGSGSSLVYSGSDVNNIGFFATLTLDNSEGHGTGTLINTGGPNPDALSNTLTTNSGILTLQNNATLTLNSGNFENTNDGVINVLNTSTLDLSNVTFLNESGGTLNHGEIHVGGGSVLTYAGNDIDTIGIDQKLVLESNGSLVNANGGLHNAITGSLTTVNGYLGLDDGAYLGLSHSLTNTGTVDLTGGGNTLRAQGFTNSGLLATINVGDQDTADFRTGGTDPHTFTNFSGGTLTGGAYNIAGNFLYDGDSGTGAGAINAISGALVHITGSGQIGYGGGAFGTDGLAGISSVSGGTQGQGGLAFDGMSSPYTITPTTGTLAIAGRDTDFSSTAVLFGVLNGTDLKVAGNLTNTASVTSGGQVSSGVGAIDAGLTITGDLTNTAILSTTSGADNATAEIAVLGGGMAVYGDFLNQVTKGAGATGTAAAIVTVTSGDLNVTGNFTNTGGAVFLNEGGALKVGGDLTNTGAMTTGSFGGSAITVTGNVFNTSPGVLNLRGIGDTVTAATQFVNSGTVNMHGDLETVQAYQGFDNKAGGLVSMTGNGDIFEATGSGGGCGCAISPFGPWAGGGSLPATGSNEGTFLVTGTNGKIITDGNFTNSGTVILSSTGNSLTVRSGAYTQTGGTTEVDAGNTLQAATIGIDGGTVTGGGTLIGNVTNGGTINPGDPVSLFITGMFTQTSMGVLNMDLASDTSFDQVNVTGDVNLDGTLDLTLDSGFTASTPTIGTIFDILHWTGIETGDFATFHNVVSSGGWQYTFTELAITGNHLDIQLTGASQTPEPSTFVMLFGGFLAGTGVHWRRRKKNVGRS